jgi:hypothetical protein
MKSIYKIYLQEPIAIEDFWPVDAFGGKLVPLERENLVIGFQISFTGQPVEYAPQFMVGSNRIHNLNTENDPLRGRVQAFFENSFSYLQCYFDIRPKIKEIESFYEPENDDEKKRINVNNLKFNTNNAIPLPLNYSLLTRAFFAGEVDDAPQFDAALVAAARDAMKQERYIDSFRYSFLLIEATFGNGKFKNKDLVSALSSSMEFKKLVEFSLSSRLKPKINSNIKIEQMLSSSPSIDVICKLLVNERGKYFHGNRRRAGSWRANDQAEAETLALFALEIATGLAQRAAGRMFDDNLGSRHFESAVRSEAVMKLKIVYEYSEPGKSEIFSRTVIVNVPGNKFTSQLPTYVAKESLEIFDRVSPVGGIRKMTCYDESTGEKLYEFVTFLAVTMT